MPDIKETIAEYIQAKKDAKKQQERIRAMETIILDNQKNDPDFSDDRITIVEGRKIYSLKDEVYEKLEKLGVQTEEKITRRFDLKDFSKEIQDLILSNEKNYNVKQYKTSIRIKKGSDS